MPDTYWDLFACYTAFWAIVGGFVLTLGREQRALARRIEELENSQAHAPGVSQRTEGSQRVAF